MDAAVHDPIEKHQPITEKGLVIDYQNGVIDPGVEDKRLLVVEPEFASTLRVLGRDGNTLSPLHKERLGWCAVAHDDQYLTHESDERPRQGLHHAYVRQHLAYGFHNDTTPRYDEAAAKLSWDRTVAFFNENLRS